MSRNWVFVRLGGSDAKPGDGNPPAAEAPVQAAPAEDDPPSAWAEAVCNATDKALATEWAKRVEGDDLLAEVAIHSRFSDIRLAAARRIGDLAVLKRVAEATKDKHVHRHCADRLRASRQEGTRARRSVELAAAVRQLLDTTPIAINHLLEIEKDLASLGKGGEETAECEALLAEARERVLEETQAQIEMRGLLASAETLLIAVRTAIDPTADQLGDWSAQHSMLVEAASAAPQWVRTIPAARNFVTVLEEIENRVHAYGDALEKVVLEEEKRVATEEAEREARQAAEAAAERAAGAQQKKKYDHEAVQKVLGEFEAHLEEGRVAEAEAASKGIDRLLGGAVPSGQLMRRLQRARAQKDRLAGWARWGTDKAREQLIAEAETLLQGEPDIAERARAVPLLRREWKNLDAHGAAPQALWKKFDRAIERAYKPVAEQRALEAAAHDAARAIKAALLDGWEAWHGTLAETDLKTIEAKRDEVSRQWRSAARAGFRDERQLRKRFDALIEKLDAQLDEARAKEFARLKDLVDQAEALKDKPELGEAMSAAKTLQRRWKDEVTGIRLRHGEDQKLWRRFRSACDAVFARRDAENAERDAQRAKREEERAAAQEAVRQAEQQKKDKHAARFAELAEKSAAAATEAAPEALERGHAERDTLLLDLEIALDLPTPETHSAARRARNLAKLQERFSKTASAPPLEPEEMVKKWYGIPAVADEAQAARMAAVVERLLKQKPPQARNDSFPSRGAPSSSRGARSPSRGGFPSRKDSRS
jgi:exonuclease SbcC